MARPFLVKTRFLLLLATLALVVAASAEEPPAQEILQTVRRAQTASHAVLTGRLRTGAKAIPFRLTASAGTIRWDFRDPAQTLLLHLGAEDSRLEEIGKAGPEKVTAARFDDKVRDSDLSYEDLALRFLYWAQARVEGEQIMLLQPCWIVRVEPPGPGVSQYAAVKLWIAKSTGALMQAEALGADGQLRRRFKVISGQSVGDGQWILKQMRIETPAGARGTDRTPSYLEIDKPAP